MSPLLLCLILSQYYQVHGLATEVRLSQGQASYEGAIEVLVNGTWGPILGGGVDSTTAKTICKILGHGFTGFVVEQFEYSGVPLLNSLSCVGNEISITECTQDPSSSTGEKYDAPGVHCLVCDDGHYGPNCSQVCDCELNNVDLTLNERSCDAVTGRCVCQSDWTGVRCDIVSTKEASDTQSLIILLSLASVGCLLLMINITLRVYNCRNRVTKGSGSTSPQEMRDTLKTGKSSHFVHTATMPSADGADYNTINDCMVDVDINADTEYDNHPDLLKRTDRIDGRNNEHSGNDLDGFLKAVPTNTCIGPDTLLETDNEGYLKMSNAVQQLSGVSIDDRSKLQNPYEELKDFSQVEHEYTYL